MGRKSGSHTVATKYINIHTVTNAKQKKKKNRERKYTISLTDG